MISKEKKKVLLHVCCAPCATHVINRLKLAYNLTFFFYNPNIYPEYEYKKRLENAKKIAEKLRVPLVEGKYDPDNWLKAVKGYEEDKEGGERCSICFNFRLEKAAKYAKENNFNLFTTTLTISPYKNSKIINLIGKDLEQKYNIPFFESDFKKEDGYKKSIELSKRFDLYRQHYCGCVFSLNSSIASPKL